MAQDKIIFEIVATAKGVKVVQQQTDQLAKSTDKADKNTKKLDKSRDAYNRREKGAAGISSNTTKNFSKMQQGIDGGGGSGGLVRAYALLAANVFALTAAFGVLSRSAQIDTLVQSMEILSTTGGTYIKNLAKEMQEASGFAVDLAQSFAQVSLASSAGLNTKEIEGLTKVAKGAAISLGRNLPDAMDRIFRGAIKLEPEILDEIGLFVRVDEAAQKYARNNGKVVSALTQVEKRQAFLNEILEQGTRKFSQYAEEIKPDPYVRLGAALGDIAQGGLSLVNSVLGPLLGFLAESKGLLTLVFGTLVATLLKKAIPAMGLMTKGAAELATEQAAAAKEYSEGISENAKQAIKAEDDILTKRRKTLKDDAKNSKRFTSRGKNAVGTKALDKAKLGSDNRKLKVEERITVLKKSQRDIDNANQRMIKQELALLEEELQIERELKTLRSSTGVKPGELADRRQQKLDSKARVSTVVAGSAGTMETQGISAGWTELNDKLKIGEKQADGTFKQFSNGEKVTARLKGGVSALGVGFNKLMAIMGPAMMIFALLSPVLVAISRSMGFGREEAKKFGEELEKAADRSEKLSVRIIQQMKTVNNLEASYLQQTKAQIAFNKTMLETMKTSDDLEKSFRQMSETSTAWTRFVDDFIMGVIMLESIDGKNILSGSELQFYEQQFTNFFHNIEQAARGSNEYVRDAYSGIQGAKEYMDVIDKQVVIEDQLTATRKKANKMLEEGTLSYGDQLAVVKIARQLSSGENMNILKGTFARSQLHPVLQAEIDLMVNLSQNKKMAEIAQGRLSRETGEYKQVIADTGKVIEKETKILQNLESAMTGASESIGKFQAKFMPKTDVDDVLSSFKQMEAGFKEILSDENISDKKVDDFFNKFADSDNPFNALFSGLFDTAADGKKVLKDSENARKLFFNTIKDFEEYQQVVLTSKVELKALGSEQKRFAKLGSAGIVANTKHQQAATRIAEVNFKVKKDTNDIMLKSFGLDRETNAEMRSQLASTTNILRQNQILLSFGQDRNKLQAANSFLQEEDERRLEMRIEQETESTRIQKERLTAFKAELAILKQIEETENKFALSKQKESNRRSTGSQKLNPTQVASSEIEAAKTKLKFFLIESELKRGLLEMEADLLKTRIMLMHLDNPEAVSADDASAMTKKINSNMKFQNKLIDGQIASANSQFTIGMADSVTKAFGGGLLDGLRGSKMALDAELERFDKTRIARQTKMTMEALEEFTERTGRLPTGAETGEIANRVEGSFDRERDQLGKDAGGQALRGTAESLAATLTELGPEGAAVSSVVTGALMMVDAYSAFGDSAGTAADKAEMAGAAVAAISQMMAANSKAQIAEIDNQIEAEKKRDGKSKESVAKIAQMEKKKEAMQRKAFEQNKKMQMAQTIIATATGMMRAYQDFDGITATALMVMIGALGAAQLAIISKTQFQGSGGGIEKPAMGALSIGKRDNKVDVSRGASGGEMGYLRGGRGVGSNANDFKPTGGAYGMKGYAAGGEGILVGEQGPEIVKPTQSVDVVQPGMGDTQNINFTINTIDSQGVEDFLGSNAGAIISSIRGSANGYGAPFLEQIDTDISGGQSSYKRK